MGTKKIPGGRMLAFALLLVGCSTTVSSSSPDPTRRVVNYTSVAPTTTEATTTTVAPTTTEETTTTTVAPETERVIGYSVAGRPIMAYRRGTPGGVPVVAVGAIHGDEVGGTEVALAILAHQVPEGIELWVIPVANPDGYVAQRRQNDRKVDLNRNFPTADWAETGRGSEKWSGWLPASEPETLALMDFFLDVRPVMTIWYHQNGLMVDTGSKVANPALRVKYSEISGWPLREACPNVCRGTATGFTNSMISGSSAFVVELRWGVTPEIASIHAHAFFETAIFAVSGS